MLPCPNCSQPLKTKIIHTVGAGKIDVDYCASCGGIFFDKGEVNRVSAQAAQELITEAEKHATSGRHDGDHNCPRCGASLEKYYGESVPDDVHVLRCPDCSGTWFEGEELEKFKEAQDAKINYFRTWKMPLPSLSAVLIPIAVLITLTGVTLITVDQIKKGTQTSTRATEVLTTPVIVIGEDGLSATIVFTTTEPARTDLEFSYHDARGDVIIPISQELRTAHQVTVTDLTIGVTYSYRIDVITAEESFISDTYTFEL